MTAERVGTKCVLHLAASPLKLQRMSVTPATSQMRAPAGKLIMVYPPELTDQRPQQFRCYGARQAQAAARQCQLTADNGGESGAPLLCLTGAGKDSTVTGITPARVAGSSRPLR